MIDIDTLPIPNIRIENCYKCGGPCKLSCRTNGIVRSYAIIWEFECLSGCTEYKVPDMPLRFQTAETMKHCQSFKNGVQVPFRNKHHFD
jgi:MinD superfamily P-loop ATPase